MIYSGQWGHRAGQRELGLPSRTSYLTVGATQHNFLSWPFWAKWPRDHIRYSLHCFFISSCASTPERSLLLGDSADGQSIEITLRVIGGNTRKPMPLMGITHTRWSLNLNFLPSHSSSSFLPLLLTLLFPFSAYFSTLVVNGLKTIVIPRLRMEVRSKEAKKEGGGEGKR